VVCSVLLVCPELAGARADVHVLCALHGSGQGPGTAAQVPLVVTLPHPVPDVPVRHQYGAGENPETRHAANADLKC